MSRPVLLLDIMSTVVYDPIFHEIPSFFGLTLEEFFRSAKPHTWIDFELGRLSEDEAMAHFFRDGRDFDVDAFKATVRSAYRFIDDGMEPLLRELREGGIEMHALSNYPPWYQMIEGELRLSRFLDWSFVSCNLGVRKPDPDIFAIACDRLAVAPSAALFVDDRDVNCEGARSTGMDAVRFESSAQLRETLRDRGWLR